jgi:predicted nucleotidyltransferase
VPIARGRLLAELRAHAEEIQGAARRRRIRNVRVFGSAARGEETPASDVDLLVDFDASKHGVLPLVGFASDVRAIIGRDVDATTVDILRDEVRKAALAEAVPL